MHLFIPLAMINVKKSDLYQTDRRVWQRRRKCNVSSPRVISGMRKECTFNHRSFIDVVKYWRQSAVLSLSYSHSHSLFIVLFGFINIRYVFVCIVLRNDHEDRATMICLDSQFNELCLTIESICN